MTTNIQRQVPRAGRFELCLDRRCRTFEPEIDLADIPSKRLSEETRALVRLRVFRSGDVIARDGIYTRFQRTQPNGPDCPPTCFGAFMFVGSNLELGKQAEHRGASCAGA